MQITPSRFFNFLGAKISGVTNLKFGTPLELWHSVGNTGNLAGVPFDTHLFRMPSPSTRSLVTCFELSFRVSGEHAGYTSSENVSNVLFSSIMAGVFLLLLDLFKCRQ